MRTAVERRLLVLACSLVGASACTLLVPVDGLTGGSGDAGADGGELGGGSAPGEDAQGPITLGPTPTPAGDAALPAPRDGAPAGDSPGSPDAGMTPDASVHDAAPGPGPPATDAAPDVSASIDATPPHDATPPRDAPTNACTGDLSNVGAGDFHVTLTLRTAQSGLVAVLNQRATCSASAYWDMRLASGEVRFEIADGATSTDLTGTGPQLDDGAPHTVSIVRATGTVIITIDGATSGAATGAGASLGALPALVSGSDPCEGSDGTAALQGAISNVCVGGG